MALPRVDELRKAILLLMIDEQEHHTMELQQILKEYYYLDDHEYEERRRKDQNTYFQERFHQALTDLRYALFIKRLSHGRYKITDQGKRAAEMPFGIYNDDLINLSTYREYQLAKRNNRDNTKFAEPIDKNKLLDRDENPYDEFRKFLSRGEKQPEKTETITPDSFFECAENDTRFSNMILTGNYGYIDDMIVRRDAVSVEIVEDTIYYTIQQDGIIEYDVLDGMIMMVAGEQRRRDGTVRVQRDGTRQFKETFERFEHGNTHYFPPSVGSGGGSNGGGNGSGGSKTPYDIIQILLQGIDINSYVISLRHVMTVLGVGRDELANAINRDPSTIKHYRTGRTRPNAETNVRINIAMLLPKVVSDDMLKAGNINLSNAIVVKCQYLLLVLGFIATQADLDALVSAAGIEAVRVALP